ncbi:MAG: hypothetical protein RL272_693 [Candidatus Parcubacteria bacterium]|jgi:type IV secretory pathway component VirB8
MDNELEARMAAQEKKLDAIFVSVEKTRKYFLWTMIITVAMIVLPLIGIAFVVPTVISAYSSALGL